MLVKGFSENEILSHCDYRLNLLEIHNRLKQMILSFDTFCHANSLIYYPAGGTLIGTIRHNGFIPWDDDVDFYMPRKDYEKLICFKQINEEIDVVTINNNDEYYHPFQHCNLSDNRTLIISRQLKYNTGKGQFIDIFPLDNVPNKEEEKKQFMRDIYNKCRVCSYAINPYRNVTSMKDVSLNLLSFALQKIDIPKRICEINKLAQTYNDTMCMYWGPISREAKDRLIWKKEWFSSTFRHKFEDIEIDVPIGYDSILRHTFGDYMQLPPENQRGNQHEIEVYWRK